MARDERVTMHVEQLAGSGWTHPPGPRASYGAARLRRALAQHGIDAHVLMATADSAAVRDLVGRGQLDPAARELGPESFCIRTMADEAIAVVGGDESGVLYGCLELARRIERAGRLPDALDVRETPAMLLRGPCIGMQKTFILPGRRVYEYPYTPELFPFFYDRDFWRSYLDFLVELRMNTLYLWNGHPFSSLVRVKEYPYAVEVPDDVFRRNVEMFHFIAEEADRRGIWLLQKFYSIILPKPFAEHHGIETQLAKPTPEASDYTRKAIAEFVREYPSVGLLVCLGEALQGLDNQTFWLRDVVLAGVRDGMQAAGLEQEPPVVVRAHATDPTVVLPPALKVYGNLYTMAKYNGESLTTSEPRGVRQKVHLAMSQMGRRHVSNVHILANLEPFRYGAQRFIKQCVRASRDRLGCNGLHLYPLAYWSWPDAPDAVEPPLQQIDRDWIWFEAWARYAWNPDIDDTADRAYWIGRLAERYGSAEAAAHILDAYNHAGECAPRILRRFGITEGNRQTMSLGMTLDQLVEPRKYRPFPELWESQAPPGERLEEYIEREVNGQPHEGETPPRVVGDILRFSQLAVEAIESAAPLVSRDRAEFERLRNDILCIRAMSQFYAAKARAAMCVLRYRHTRDLPQMRQAALLMAESVRHFRTLTRLTTGTYAFANTMQTSQRRIPVPGGIDGKPANYHWSHLLPIYEQELREFEERVAALLRGEPDQEDESAIKPLPRAAVRVLSPGAETYEVNAGVKVYTDRPYLIQSVAAELIGLTGIRFAHTPAKEGRYEPVEFETDEPVQVLVGYFQDPRPIFLQPPDLETDADAVERGGAEPVIENAATIDSLPAVNVYALKFPAGRQKLDLRGKGSFIVLGVVPQTVTIPHRDARRGGAA